jgi:hypothetical protein
MRPFSHYHDFQDHIAAPPYEKQNTTPAARQEFRAVGDAGAGFPCKQFFEYSRYIDTKGYFSKPHSLAEHSGKVFHQQAREALSTGYTTNFCLLPAFHR